MVLAFAYLARLKLSDLGRFMAHLSVQMCFSHRQNPTCYYIYCKFRETESSLLSSCSFLLSQIEQLLCSGLKANGDFFTASRKYCC
jgi:hypothetical protein